jgi:hypothetical protein
LNGERLRRALLMCARTDKASHGFVDRMTTAASPPKVILVAVTHKPVVSSARRHLHLQAVPSGSSRSVAHLNPASLPENDQEHPTTDPAR